jgi:hypothetical protein
MAVPYTFATATSSIPLSQLDSNFATGITLGNTTVYLGNTTTSFGNMTLTNVTISSVSTPITVTQGGTGLATITTGQVLYGNGTGSISTSSNLFFSGTKLGVNTSSPAVTAVFSGTDAIQLPSGTTGQQPTGAAGMLRFNSTTSQFEGYNGSAWASVGGSAISNDTSTATFVYPLFSANTTGTALTVNTSNANLLYKPSTGELQAQEVTANNGLHLNASTVNNSYTVATGYNAMSVGPITVASGKTVTVSSGSRYVVL